MTSAPIHDDVLDAAHDAIVTLAVALVQLDDHTREHGHADCPTCQRLGECVEWLAAYRELQADAAHLLRAADALMHRTRTTAP